MNFHHCLFKILKKNQNITDGRTDGHMDGKTDRWTMWKQYTSHKHSLRGGIDTNRLGQLKKCCNYPDIGKVLFFSIQKAKSHRRNSKHCGPRSDCSFHSSLIWVCTVWSDTPTECLLQSNIPLTRSRRQDLSFESHLKDWRKGGSNNWPLDYKGNTLLHHGRSKM